MTALLIIASCLYIGGLHIEIEPFKITLPYWRTSISLLLFVAAMYMSSQESYRKGYKDGVKVKEILR